MAARASSVEMCTILFISFYDDATVEGKVCFVLYIARFGSYNGWKWTMNYGDHHFCRNFTRAGFIKCSFPISSHFSPFVKFHNSTATWCHGLSIFCGYLFLASSPILFLVLVYVFSLCREEVQRKRLPTATAILFLALFNYMSQTDASMNNFSTLAKLCYYEVRWINIFRRTGCRIIMW